MSINPLAISIRARKLAVLMTDARTASRRSIADCARAVGVSESDFQAFETGAKSPSLPELELLAYYLNVPLEQFWGRQTLSENSPERAIPHADRLMTLRHRMIGAGLRQVRTQANLSAREVFTRTGITEADLKAYEMGEKPVPLPILEILVTALGSHMDVFMDTRGPVGAWRAQQKAIEQFLELPPELQEFTSKSVNRPYLELAIRLSELSVEKLRAVAEGLLEITY
jgi:transcriptional regulator with XRE-family HTH domain